MYNLVSKSIFQEFIIQCCSPCADGDHFNFVQIFGARCEYIDASDFRFHNRMQSFIFLLIFINVYEATPLKISLMVI